MAIPKKSIEQLWDKHGTLFSPLNPHALFVNASYISSIAPLPNNLTAVGLPSLDEGLSDEELALKIQAQEREDFALGRQDALITMVQGLAQSSTFKPGQYQASVSAICEAFRR